MLALIVAVALGAPPASASLFNARTFTLANGMQVVVIPDHRAPVVTHMVWYRVGAADEKPGESGTAHFLEHLMFKGTATVAPGELSKIVARNGGRDNAFTSYDYTAYFEQVAKDKLDLVMGLEADRMTNLTLSEADVETERNVVIEERRQRTDSSPHALFGEQLNAALYLQLPYRLPVIGWEHEIKNLDRATALAFYRVHYAPNNAILIVAGDVTVDQVRELAEKNYGPIPRAATPPRLRPQEPPQIAPRRLTYRDPRVANPSWRRGYVAPSFHAGETRYAGALRLLADIFGGSSVSRLYKKLVVEQGIAASAGSYYDGIDYDLGSFWISARPSRGVAPADLERAIDAEIAELVSNGITEAELERAKTQALAGAVYARDSLSRAARIVGAALASGLTLEQVETWPDQVEKISVEEVNAAARAVFKIERSVTGLLLPRADEG